jgi:hypothetical protein
MGQLQEALRTFEQALELDSTYAQVSLEEAWSGIVY